MEIQTLSPRQLAVNKLVDRFKLQLSGTSATTTFMTCSSAPAFGWSVEEYALMPIVASEMRKEGYVVTSSVNHGVTDWVLVGI